MKRKPAAFMSYAHIDDKYRRLTEFRERLSHEVRVQTGEEFLIFQDRKNIQWGQTWKARIEGALYEVTFLIPIITPSFFKSQPCRCELERFSEREKELKRDDLILPVYYVDCPLLNDEAERATDELTQVIYAHQWADWRDLRHYSWDSQQVRKALGRLAVQIRDALERVSEEITRRASAKTKPQTLVVDKTSGNEYVTITEAIRAANPGDRILVCPGLYREGLIMDKPLEIIGDGGPGEVVVEAEEEDVLSFMTMCGCVANLTLRQIGGEDCYSVDIAQGRLDLEDCDITSQSLACVAIHGGADPRLRRNRIHDGKASGVIVFDNSQGTLEENDIFGNALAGVGISEGSNPTLRHNRIYDGKDAGIAVIKDGQGMLEDNDIFGNALAGVAISAGGNPILRRNHIHDGKQSGIYVYEDGQGTLENNDIFGNTLAGIKIEGGGDPILRQNRVHKNNDGIYVYGKGQGMLENNDIFSNAYSGVEIATGGNPTLRRNRIYDGKQTGVYVRENGLGVLEDNDIFGNAKAGVTITTGGNPTLCHNHVNENGYVAVQVYNQGAGIIKDNDLSGNIGGVWDISADSEPNVKRARNKE